MFSVLYSKDASLPSKLDPENVIKGQVNSIKIVAFFG